VATKKQKREIAEAKHAAYEAKVKADGLAALERDRRAREDTEVRMKEAVQRFNARHKQIFETGYAKGIADFSELIEAVPPAEIQTVPVKDKPGGDVIGSATVRQTDAGMEFDMKINDPVIMQKILGQAVEGVGESVFEDLALTMLENISTEVREQLKPTFSPEVKEQLEKKRAFPDDWYTGQDEQWDMLDVAVREHFLRLLPKDWFKEYLEGHSEPELGPRKIAPDHGPIID
jgi:hypothetical protein